MAVRLFSPADVLILTSAKYTKEARVNGGALFPGDLARTASGRHYRIARIHHRNGMRYAEGEEVRL